MRFRRSLHPEFWRSLSRAGYVSFVLAVAATFGSMGFLIDLVHTDTPFSNALYGAVLCALIAIGWFVSMTRELRLLPIVLVVHAVGTWFLAGPSRQPPFAVFAGMPLDQRLSLDMTGALVCILLGYGGFVVFAAREGRQPAARTRPGIRPAARRSDTPVDPFPIASDEGQLHSINASTAYTV